MTWRPIEDAPRSYFTHFIAKRFDGLKTFRRCHECFYNNDKLIGWPVAAKPPTHFILLPRDPE